MQLRLFDRSGRANADAVLDDQLAIRFSQVNRWEFTPLRDRRRFAKNEALNTLIEFAQSFRRAPLMLKSLEACRRADPNSLPALHDVSFNIKKGMAVGVVDPAGIGKTAIVQLAGRGMHPNGGKVIIRGSVANLSVIPALAMPNWTTRENLYILVDILGIPRGVLDEQIDRIIEFSGQEELVDLPLRRLPGRSFFEFAISMICYLPFDVVVAEEILPIASPGLRERVKQRLKLSPAMGQTLIFSSKKLAPLLELSSHLLLIEEGRVRCFGPTDQVMMEHGEFVSDAVEAAAQLGVAETSIVGDDEEEAEDDFDPLFGDGPNASEPSQQASLGSSRTALIEGKVGADPLGPPLEPDPRSQAELREAALERMKLEAEEYDLDRSFSLLAPFDAPDFKPAGAARLDPGGSPRDSDRTGGDGGVRVVVKSWRQLSDLQSKEEELKLRKRYLKRLHSLQSKDPAPQTQRIFLGKWGEIRTIRVFDQFGHETRSHVPGGDVFFEFHVRTYQPKVRMDFVLEVTTQATTLDGSGKSEPSPGVMSRLPKEFIAREEGDYFVLVKLPGKLTKQIVYRLHVITNFHVVFRPSELGFGSVHPKDLTDPQKEMLWQQYEEEQLAEIEQLCQTVEESEVERSVPGDDENGVDGNGDEANDDAPCSPAQQEAPRRIDPEELAKRRELTLARIQSIKANRDFPPLPKCVRNCKIRIVVLGDWRQQIVEYRGVPQDNTPHLRPEFDWSIEKVLTKKSAGGVREADSALESEEPGDAPLGP